MVGARLRSRLLGIDETLLVSIRKRLLSMEWPPGWKGHGYVVAYLLVNSTCGKEQNI